MTHRLKTVISFMAVLEGCTVRRWIPITNPARPWRICNEQLLSAQYWHWRRYRHQPSWYVTRRNLSRHTSGATVRGSAALRRDTLCPVRSMKLTPTRNCADGWLVNA